QLFAERFACYSDDSAVVSFNNFLRFHKDLQNDDMGLQRERASDFLRQYLREWDPSRDIPEPSLCVAEFCDFLFSRENSLWDPINEHVVHDMKRPLMDCWDGPKRNCGEVKEIVIYHGHTMTSKISLRDVLYTIRHYSFINSEFPVILSIEDNCSVPAQRLLARDVKEILGDHLLTAPVSHEETCLPSPEALKRKIILKHKKLPTESEDIVPQQIDEGYCSRNCS
ncbi:unnamed protein product, partial [Gongylonema pulchrum]|uniref:Phosphoinositide phospholipase C n=1 Tax=Gongylonema pulchrum TaxID=637853 RepID=A0A183E0M7_9BILA